MGEQPPSSETRYPQRNKLRIEGGWAKKVIVLTWGRPVGEPGTCNYDRDLLSTAAMLVVMDQGVSDQGIVVVKL